MPGGIGVTAWLARDLRRGRLCRCWVAAEGMVEGFRSLLPTGGAVLVSAEAGDYRPEMEWLVRQLGPAWEVATAETYHPGRARFVSVFRVVRLAVGAGGG